MESPTATTFFTVFHRVPSPTHRLRHPWRTLFLTREGFEQNKVRRELDGRMVSGTDG
jgi:hypothetical protein